MSKYKRNDPCYCGSGEKYKNCHFKQDQEEEKARRQLYMAGQFLRQDLLKFARDDRFTTPLKEALAFYWDGHYTHENADEMSQPEALRFFDWFVFDHRWQDESGETQRLGDIYLAENGEGLTSYQREMLSLWLDANPSWAYELTGYEGQELQLKDVVSGEEFEVYEGAGHGEAEPGDLILARLVPVGERLEFSTNAAYLPKAEVGDLPDTLKAAREADPDSDYAAFMQQHGHLAIHHGLAAAALQGRPPVARMNPDRDDQRTVKAMQTTRRMYRRQSR
jgi:hypothetical protein